MIYLIFGPPGAGKTTHAKRIADEKQSALFLIDEYLKPLPVNLWEIPRKKLECEIQILELSELELSQGKNVVLDIAAFQRIDRDRVRSWARGVNTPLELHYITASQIVRKDRVAKRNREKGDAYSFDVSEVLFGLVETIFEPPSEDEGAILFIND